MNEDFDYHEGQEAEPAEAGSFEERAREDLIDLFNANKEAVFFSRQLEVRLEANYFHWLTNRMLRRLETEGQIRGNIKELRFGGVIKTYWHRKNRYYKRAEKKVIEMVELYSAPTVGGALGHHGELLVLEGFAKKGFLLTGRHTQEHGGRRWSGGDHNLDMIVEKDDQAYGVEVKNTLTYIDREDFDVKIKLCGELGVTPVFAVRMLPTTWFKELVHKAKGFGLIFEWQLYPFGHKEVADEVRATLGLPVDCPASLEEGTMDRFVNWHKGRL